MAILPGIPETRVGLDTTGGVTRSVADAERVGQSIASLGAEAAKQEKLIEERAAAAYASKASAALQFGALQDFNAMKTDGGDVNTFVERFSESFIKRRDAALEAAPNPVARQLMEDRGNGIFRAMADNAFAFQSQESMRLQKLDLEESFNLQAQMAAQDPGMLPGILQTVDADVDNASLTMLASDAKAMRSKARGDIVALAVASQVADRPGHAEELLHQYGSELDAGTQLRLRESIAASHRAIDGLLRTDPAKYVQKMEPGITPAESVAQQRELGVPEVNLRALTKEQAADTAARINSVKSADELTAVMGQLEDAHRGHFNVLLRDLQGAGLKGDYQFAMNFDPVMDNDAMRAHFEVLKAGESAIRDLAKQKMQTKDKKFTDLEDAVGENLSSILEAQAAAGMPVEAIRESLGSMTNIAAYYYSQGGTSVEDAANRATQWLTDKFTVESAGKGAFVVPNSPEYDPERIADALTNIMRNFSAGGVKLQFTDRQKEIYTNPENYAKAIREKGGFVGNPYNDGVLLVDNNGRLVFGEDGQPVEYKFSYLTEYFDNIARENRRKLGVPDKLPGDKP